MSKFIQISRFDHEGAEGQLSKRMIIIAQLAGGKSVTHLDGFDQEFERIIFEDDEDINPDVDEIEWYTWLESVKLGKTNKNLAREFSKKFLSPKHNYPSSRAPTGPRPNAGRPSTLKNAVRVTIWLEAEQLAWVNAQGEQGDVIRRLVEQGLQAEEIAPGPRPPAQGATSPPSANKP